MNGRGLIAELGDFIDDLFDEGLGGVWAKDDDHGFFYCGRVWEF
jgi:hypothetical protein